MVNYGGVEHSPCYLSKLLSSEGMDGVSCGCDPQGTKISRFVFLLHPHLIFFSFFFSKGVEIMPCFLSYF